MDVANLVHMANRIGEFFQAMPDRQEAKDGVAQHIRKFWEPRMRRELLAHADQRADPALCSLVLEALAEQRFLLLPTDRPGAQRRG
jgi:formate dehydrogenase subunit delta